MNLFQYKPFISTAGIPMDFKIECDALTKDDWECIAAQAVKLVRPFNAVFGVPDGGLPFENAMRKYEDRSLPASQILIVDDVYSTGKSVNEFLKNYGFDTLDYQVCVAFNRSYYEIPSIFYLHPLLRS